MCLNTELTASRSGLRTSHCITIYTAQSAAAQCQDLWKVSSQVTGSHMAALPRTGGGQEFIICVIQTIQSYENCNPSRNISMYLFLKF